jgi:hypothetical protein
MKYSATLMIVGQAKAKVLHHELEAPNAQAAARAALTYWRMTLDCEPEVETVIHIYAVNEETGEREPDVLAVLSWQRSTEAEGADCS